MYNILICDDDADIRAALRLYLAPEGYGIFEAADGAEALALLARETIHLVLMDLMMPQLDGVSATAQLRQRSNVPVIMLTAKSEDADKVLGLNVGADDYITKPFSPLEVQARVRSHLRRYTALGGMTSQPGKLINGGICLDNESRELTVDGEPVLLTPIEYSILLFLMRAPGKVFSSAEIYRAVWKEDPLGSDGAVAVHIRHLREKIEINPSKPRYLKVIWGQGYKMEVQK